MINKNDDLGTELQREVRSLKRLARWQGRAIALLVLALVAAIGYPYVDWQFITDALNKQAPLESKPNLDINNLEYLMVPYQGTTALKHGDTINKEKILVIVHLYDYTEVMQDFPELTLNVNGLAMELNSAGEGSMELNLKEGDNIIESYYRYQSKDYQKKQIIIKYQPENVQPTEIQTQ